MSLSAENRRRRLPLAQWTYTPFGHNIHREDYHEHIQQIHPSRRRLVPGPRLLGLAQADTVKIGNIEPMSGPSATLGKQGKAAREMAVEEINAAGGIKSLGGAKLELIYADSESKPEKGVAEAERLINTEKVHVLTGCWNSAVTYPTTAVAERYGIPFVVPVSVSDKITDQGFKNVFRIAAKDSWWTKDQFTFLKDMQAEFGTKVETLAFVYENGDWGKGFATQWKKLAEDRRLQGRPGRTLSLHHHRPQPGRSEN